MINKSTMMLSAAALAMLSMTASPAEADSSKEKCYGVVKAGKNDCATASGSHSCAGVSKTDGAKDEWILLPKGACERLVNGSTK